MKGFKAKIFTLTNKLELEDRFSLDELLERYEGKQQADKGLVQLIDEHNQKLKERVGIDRAESHDAVSGLTAISKLQDYSLTEKQFAMLIGRCKMYQYLSTKQKLNIPQLDFGDYQINAICRDYYQEKSFCRTEDGEINLWRLYNLFTGSNKSTYIDSFADRAVQASSFIIGLKTALELGGANWFLC